MPSPVSQQNPISPSLVSRRYAIEASLYAVPARRLQFVLFAAHTSNVIRRHAMSSLYSIIKRRDLPLLGRHATGAHSATRVQPALITTPSLARRGTPTFVNHTVVLETL